MYDSSIKMVRRAMAVRQTLKGTGKSAAQCIGLIQLPVVEFRTIAQTKTCQKVILIERDCCGQRLLASSASFVCGVSMCPTFRKETQKNMHIDLKVSMEV